MEISLNREKLNDFIDREVSKVAASEHSEDGTSLYDSVRITSADRDEILIYTDRAVTILLNRFADIAATDGGILSFDVPDAVFRNVAAVSSALHEYIAYYVCQEWFSHVLPSRKQEYETYAGNAIVSLASLLKTRRKPQRNEVGN